MCARVQSFKCACVHVCARVHICAGAHMCECAHVCGRNGVLARAAKAELVPLECVGDIHTCAQLAGKERREWYVGMD